MVVKVVIDLWRTHYKLNPSTQNLLSWIISSKISSFHKFNLLVISSIGSICVIKLIKQNEFLITNMHLNEDAPKLKQSTFKNDLSNH
jgi:hypothetical protein